MQDMAMGGMAMAQQPAMPGQQQDFAKLYAMERDSLDLVEHVGILDDVEARVLRLYGFEV